MKRQRRTAPHDRQEQGAVRKSWAGRFPVALVYPNTYPVGMANLGFQAVYRLFNAMERVVCERVFLDSGVPVSIESGRRLHEFDLIACSISFENDYPNLLGMLDRAGIPLSAEDRPDGRPILVAGGVACTLNPEPIAPFVDAVLIGEAEPLLSGMIAVLAENPAGPKTERLLELARNVPGAYVPAFYRPEYRPDGTLAAVEPIADVPETVRRQFVADLAGSDTCTAVITPDSTFDRSFLIEVSRGCPHGCRFCSAGYVYRPPRFRPMADLKPLLAAGCRRTDRIGLVGAAISDLPGIQDLCTEITDRQVHLSFSSLRADGITPELLDVLRASGVKTATIAPDAGSQRMRDVINKGLDEATILDAAETLVAGGIPNLKLYFMVGLPTETRDDAQAIVTLCKRIKHRFLASSRARRRIGEITVSLNCFVPKPVTPFQWSAMADPASLKDALKQVKNGLKAVPNVRVHADVPRWAYVQALLSRGDRRVADILRQVHATGGNWPQTLKASVVNPDFYVRRERGREECLPWDIIDHGIETAYLWHEYQRALSATPSPPCPMENCAICGACRNTDAVTGPTP